MAIKRTPNIEYTHFFPEATAGIDLASVDVGELDLPSSLRAQLRHAGLGSVADLIPYAQRATEKSWGIDGVGPVKQDRIRGAVLAKIVEAKGQAITQDEINELSTAIHHRAFAIIDLRFPFKRCRARWISTDTGILNGRRALRIRWYAETGWQGRLAQCKRDDPHFHKAPPNQTGVKDTIREVVDG